MFCIGRDTISGNFALLFSSAVRRSGTWKNVHYLKMLDSYEAMDHLSYETIMLGIKARVDSWYAVAGRQRSRATAA